MRKRFPFVVTAILLTLSSVPAISLAQSTAEETEKAAASDLQAQRARYRSTIADLAAVESEILKLRNSELQSAFDDLESAVVGLEAKRKLLQQLEAQWAELDEDEKPSVEIEPLLNHSEQSKRQMLVDLVSSIEKV